MFFKKKRCTIEKTIAKMEAYAELGYGDFGSYSQKNNRPYIPWKKYYGISCDGRIIEDFTSVPSFNYFENKNEAEMWLDRLKERASRKDYSDKQVDDNFWFITPDGLNGGVCNVIYCAWDVNGMKSIGNCFDSEGEAQEALEKLRILWRSPHSR